MKETQSKKTEEFKGVLLYTDQTKKDRLTLRYQLKIYQINNFIGLCESLLKKKLTKSQINSVLNNPIQFAETVKKSIRDSFQFPDATEEFNLTSKGISFDGLETALLITGNKEYKYLITGNKVEEEPTQINEINLSSQVFTINSKQNKVLKIAKSLKELAEQMKELKITYSDSTHHFIKGTSRIIESDISTGGLVINYYKILGFK